MTEKIGKLGPRVTLLMLHGAIDRARSARPVSWPTSWSEAWLLSMPLYIGCWRSVEYDFVRKWHPTCAANAESGSDTESMPAMADISAMVSRARHLNCKRTSVPRIGYTPAHLTRRWTIIPATASNPMRMTSTVLKYDIRYCNDECKFV